MSKPPFTLAIAAAILTLEGLTILGLGAYAAVQTVVGRPVDVSTSIAEAAIGVVVGAALVWVAYGAFTAQRWSRSPGVLAQIFAVPVAVTLMQSDRQVAGAALLVAAAAGLVTLLAPPSTRVLYDAGFPGAEEPSEEPAREPEPEQGRKPERKREAKPGGKRPGSGPGRRPR